MNASHSMWKAEVIALVPAAQHSKTPTPKAWTKGTSEPRQLTQTLHAHTPVTRGNEPAARLRHARMRGPGHRRARPPQAAGGAGVLMAASGHYAACPSLTAPGASSPGLPSSAADEPPTDGASVRRSTLSAGRLAEDADARRSTSESVRQHAPGVRPGHGHVRFAGQVVGGSDDGIQQGSSSSLPARAQPRSTRRPPQPRRDAPAGRAASGSPRQTLR
jgi:hypothetical protein